VALLELDNVMAFYGPVRALNGVSNSIEPGEIVCLLGGNASGKSPTMKTILGTVRATSGTVRFGGERIDRLPTQQIVARGIALVPEARRLFAE
jgi:branched-chain amino acid transport system ATP-binding protein